MIVPVRGLTIPEPWLWGLLWGPSPAVFLAHHCPSWLAGQWILLRSSNEYDVRVAKMILSRTGMRPPPAHQLALGSVVALGHLQGCQRRTFSNGHFRREGWWWIFDNLRPLLQPILAPAGPGPDQIHGTLWTLPPGLAHRVNEQLHG